MSGQDSFQLPTCCKNAIPYFEESDTLREYALFRNDLVAAYYLRWKGVKTCIDLLSSLSKEEAAYVQTVLLTLMEQLHTLKHTYNVTENEGCTVLREKARAAYDACITYGAAKTNIIPMEYAFLYSQVVLYLSTLESLAPLTPDERDLMDFCKQEAAKCVNLPVKKSVKSIRSRMGFAEVKQPEAKPEAKPEELTEVKPEAKPEVKPEGSTEEEEGGLIEKEGGSTKEKESAVENRVTVGSSQPTEQGATRSEFTPNPALMASLYPQQNALPAHPTQPANASHLEAIGEDSESLTSSLNQQCDAINAEIGDMMNVGDDSLDVEALLGLPPMPQSAQLNESVARPEKELQSLDFTAMTKDEKGYWLNMLLTEAADVIGSIPVDQQTEAMQEIEKLISKSLECAASLTYESRVC